MSRTSSPGVHEAHYWSYTAIMVADVLEKIVRTKTFAAIPPGIRLDLEDYFKSAIEAMGEAPPRNPPASVTNYALAVEALHMAGTVPKTRQEVTRLLEKFLKLIEKLGHGETPADEDYPLAEHQAKFLRAINRIGEDQHYESCMDERVDDD